MKQPIKLSLAIALALGTPTAWALGLGGIAVKSGLNEPLVAEIAINETTPGEADGVRVSLGSAEDFKRVDLDLSGLTVALDFVVIKDKDGRPLIRVSSQTPVREPFLSFLVEVSWANGRLLREYSVLLDPPVVAPAVIGTDTVVAPVQEAPPVEAPQPLPPSDSDAEPVAEEPAPVVPGEPSEPPVEPVAETPAEPAAPVASEEPASDTSSSTSTVSAPGEYGPVAAGETLWEISTATRPDRGVTLNQMMVAILRANPDAFIRGNVNAIKRGAVLRIPSADEAQAIAVADAASEIAAQNQAWQGARSPTLIADSGAPAPTGRTPASTPPRDDSRLELVPPRAGSGGAASGVDRPGAAGGTDSTVARADLARAREQLASREQEAGELRSRVQELERLQKDSTRLVNLKDSEIAELQRRLKATQDEIERQKAVAAEARIAAAAAPSPVETAPVPVVAAPEPAPAVVEPPVETPPVASTQPEPVTETPPAASETTPPTEPVAAEPVAPETTPAITAVADPEPAPATPLEERPAMPWWRSNMLLMGASGALLIGGLLLLLLRGRRKAAPAPAARRSLAAAEAVADRGESSSSEESALLDRLASDPTDLDAHLALLRHYYGQGDAEKYEGAAGAMYAQVGDPQTPTWVEACVMGRELVPGNPMFEVAESTEGTFDFDRVAADSGLDGGFDLGTPEIEKIEPLPEAEPFDFSLEEPPAPMKTVEMKAPPPPARPADDVFRTEEFSAPQLDLDPPPPGVPAGGFFDGEDAVGTKLDLARAYLDMGDPEGARSMLQEVIAEGSDAQKQEAQRLLSDIG